MKWFHQDVSWFWSISFIFELCQKVTERNQLTVNYFRKAYFIIIFLSSRCYYTQFDTSNFRYQSTSFRSINVDVFKCRGELVSRWVGEWERRWVGERVSWWMVESWGGWVGKRMNEGFWECVSEWIGHWVTGRSEWVNERMSGWMVEWMSICQRHYGKL